MTRPNSPAFKISTKNDKIRYKWSIVGIEDIEPKDSYLCGVPGARVEPPVRACGKLAPEIRGIKIWLGYVSLI